MVLFPPCKINLGLNVIRRRSDGFHELSTCFYPVLWTDALEIVPAKDFSFSASGILVPGAAADNLCVRAYELLKKDFRIGPVAMHLMKNIPIGAGLGGGSADGAYALRILNDIFKLSLSAEQLRSYAAMLGSDCAFFIESRPMIGTGRGEILSDVKLSLKGKFLVIVKPEVQISTADAFAGISPHEPSIDVRTIVETHPLAAWKDVLVNDFEDKIFKRFPVITALKQKLYAFGAVYASMTGSGSAVYGIFDEQVDSAKEFESVQYWSGVLE
jgi:4-diphosphocytidyl-2-C-methyl-D-erythritol kinase